MVLNGIIWLYVALYGLFLPYMATYGLTWSYMAFLWSFLAVKNPNSFGLVEIEIFGIENVQEISDDLQKGL